MIRRDFIAALLILPILCGFVYFSQNQMDRHRSPEMELQEILHLPDGKILKIVSLGYNSLLADWLWIRTVLYFGKHTLDEDNPYYQFLAKHDEADAQEKEHLQASGHEGEHHHHHAESFLSSRKTMEQQEVSDAQPPNIQAVLMKKKNANLAPYVYPLLWRVVVLDPHFIYPYIFGGFIVVHETGEVDEAISLLQFGRQKNPDRWEFPFYLGYIELFFRKRTRQALEWLGEAITHPQHPGFLDNLFVTLSRASSQKEYIIEYLKTIFKSTNDEKTRQEILKILRNLSKNDAKRG